LVLINKSANAGLQSYDVEVYQQTDAALRQTQICEQDRIADGRDGLDSLQLNDNAAIDQKIDSIAAFQFRLFVNQGQRFLALEPDTPET